MRIWGWLGLATGLLWAQECDIIFVSPNGGTGPGTGTRENPAELNYAISNLLTPTIRRLYLSHGIYTLTQTLPLYNNLEIEGGFDPNQGWLKTNLFPTIIFRAAVNPTPNPNRLVAIAGVNVSGFRIQDVEVYVVYVEDATPLGGWHDDVWVVSEWVFQLCRESVSVFGGGGGAG